jgi:aspartate-semialdehyde dehydrogenase
VARELEPRLAARVPVISAASAFRYESDVPVFLPGVNMGAAKGAILVAEYLARKGHIV